MKILKALRLPLVVSILGYDYEMVVVKSGLGPGYYEKLFDFASAFTVGGPSGVKKLIEMGCPKEKIHIISLAVDPEQISFEKGKKRNDKLKLLQIATITDKKGYLTTLNAYKLAKKHYPNLTLTIIGEPLDPILVELWKSLLFQTI
ncbi:MAG: hypothetical protein R2784_10005 [Saprospiraceae bacterium]